MKNIGHSLNILKGGKVIDYNNLYHFDCHSDVYDKIHSLVLLDKEKGEMEINQMKT